MRGAWLLGLGIWLLCAAAQAQPAFRAATQAAGTSAAIAHVGAGAFGQRTSCGSVNPTIPAGSVGDGLIALVVAREDGATITMPGWALLYSNSPAGQEYQALVFGRVATGGDPNTVTQAGTCNTLIAQISRFSNLDPTTPLEPGSPSASYQVAGAVSSGSVNTTVPGSMLVAATFVAANRTVAEGAGWTQSFERANDPAGAGPDPAGISLNYQLQAGTGTFSFSNWDLSGGGTSPNHGVLLALRPRSQLTLAVPAGTTVGDVMVAAIAVGPSATAVTAPAGWTQLVATAQPAGNSSRQEIYYRLVTGAEPASYTWTFDQAPSGAVGTIASYSSVDPVSPIDVFTGNVTPSGTAHTATGTATTVNNAMVVSVHSFASSEGWTFPGGVNERADVASLAAPNGNGISLALGDAVQAVAGPTGDRTATAAGNADTGVAHIVALRPGVTVSFDIIVPQYNLDCAGFPAEITILARDVASGNIASTFSRLVNISTAPATGDWSIGTANGTLSNGVAGDGAATYQFTVADSGRIVLRLGTTTATSLTVTVQDSGTGLSSTSATINFITDGYVIIPDPVQVAGRPQTVTVQHRVSPGCGLSTGSGHGANNAVQLWLTLDPSHPVGATLPGAVAVTSVASLPTAEPGANNITLGFAGGQATFILNTTDVGKYRINIRDGLSAIRGTSPAITEKPFALGFPGIQHGVNENSALLAAAGANFSATVTAYRWENADDANNDGVPNVNAAVTGNPVTLRFAWDTTIGAGASLPSPGVTGTVTRGGATPTIAQASFLNGTATVNDLRYSEVGNVILTATARDYLNTPGVTVSGDTTLDGLGTNYVGRFRPDHFFLAAAPVPTRVNRIVAACVAPSTYTYMDEGLQVTFRLHARNAQDAVTQNYTTASNYAKLNLTNPVRLGLGAYDTAGPTKLTARVIPVSSSGSFAAGVADVTASLAIGRASPDNPDGPYSSVRIGVAPVEPAPSDSPAGDSVAMSSALFDADMEGAAGNDHKDLGVAVSTVVRFGRLRMQNALGSERVQLPVPMRTEYWNGTAFETNTDDDCTSIPRSAIALDFTGSSLSACQTAFVQDPVTFTDGVATARLAAPTPNRGHVLIRADIAGSGGGSSGNYCPAVGGAAVPTVPAALNYLLGRWDDAANPDSNANTAYDDKPSARATFGLYGSQPNNFIFFKENF